MTDAVRSLSGRLIAAFVACATTLAASGAGAQGPAYRVRDINTGADPETDSAPQDFFRLGDTVFFVADDGTHGCEVWSTDGTAAGTTMVRDLVPGPSGSCVPPTAPRYSGSFAAIGNTLFIRAGTATQELWKSDGTTGGTVRVKDFGTERFVDYLTPVGAALFFQVYNGDNATAALWRSDGSESGTVELQEFASPISWFIAADELVFFTAYPPSEVRRELWRSDGTPSGTFAIAGAPRDPWLIGAVGGRLLFAGDGPLGTELWSSDGTPDGTALIKHIFVGSGSSYPRLLAVRTDGLYFVANDAEDSTSVWKSDGTEAGTVRVESPFASIPFSSSFVDAGGRLFFLADGDELWTANLGPEAPLLLKHFDPDLPYAPGPTSPVAVGTRIFFGARALGAGLELWTSDGTVDGTRMVTDINPGAGGSMVGAEMIELNDVLLFAATDGSHGLELWRSDGTEAGTAMILDINPGIGGSHPDTLVALGDRLLFTAFEPVHGRELWSSDGTELGTSLVTDIFPGTGGALDLDGWLFSPIARQMVALQDTAVFVAEAPGSGAELWRSDGTAAGTGLIKDVASGLPSAVPALLTTVGERMYFVSSIEGYQELWRTDATEVGTSLVTEASTYEIAPVAGSAFLSLAPSDDRPGLWRMDGGVGLIRLMDFDSIPRALTDVNGTLFFLVDDTRLCSGTYPCFGVELWKSDGTTAGTTMVREIHTSCPQLRVYASELTNADGRLFFAANDNYLGAELWASDGTNTEIGVVRDIYPGYNDDECHTALSSWPHDLTAVHGTVFFAAFEPEHGGELWKSDATPDGTVLVRDINPGRGNSNPEHLTNVDGILFFSADDGVNGREMWQSDGTEAGTRLVQDIAAGASAADPREFVVAGPHVFFSADDGQSGRELWAMPLAALPPTLTPSLTPTPTATGTQTPTHPASCASDCNSDSLVTIDEIMTAVNIALQNDAITACAQADTNGDMAVTVDELVAAVAAALRGCAA